MKTKITKHYADFFVSFVIFVIFVDSSHIQIHPPESWP